MGIVCGDSKKESLPESILKVSKSICKIDTSSKLSSGFLMKLFRRNKEFFCLMMNGQIITKKMIEQKQPIIFYYDNGNKNKEITLNNDERYIKDLSEINLSAIIIEILPDDNIEKDFFLLPNIDYNYDFNELINHEIAIIQFPSGKLSYSIGKISQINNNEFTHSAVTELGSSGSPIFLKKNIKVIGIQKSFNADKTEYYGDFIGPLLSFFNKFSEFRINLDNGNYYIGELKNEIPNGKGTLYNKKGKIKYEGNFYDGKFTANGKFIYDNGNYYEGQFINGVKQGKGIIYNKNGDILYEGEFNSGKPEGKGKYINENGDYYIGDFKNGLSHGKGILYYKNGNIKYDGDFVDDKFEGEGKYIWENGNYYIGKFKNDLRHGKGVLYNKDENIRYEGDFLYGKFEGHGKYFFENGNYYVGKWKNDLRHGKGVLYYRNGSIKYKGDFFNDKKEGDGKFIYENGEYYIGQWKNDMKNGKGIEYFIDGKIKFKGEFIDDKRKENQ